jgi:Rrf2 family protein
MQITRQADYAVRAMMYLAQLGPEHRAATGTIAQEKSIPPSFLAKIVSQLSVAGLLQTSRGARGGVSLAKPAEAITLLDVVEAIDGPILLNDCVGDISACAYDDDCRSEITGGASIQGKLCPICRNCSIGLVSPLKIEPIN